MTTLPDMGLVLPTRGASGSGHWADTLDADLTLLDSHDHSSGKGVRVPSAGININADLSFNSNWAATALNRVSFTAVAPVATNQSLFVASVDNELYWRSAAGANVKITDANSLNVAAFTGGFGGDYTAVAAEANYDDSNSRYTFKQGGGTNWARIACGSLRLFEFNTSETLYVEQVAPAALGGSYTMTWPTALPGSAVAVQIDNGGQLIFSNTFANAVSMSSTLGVTGIITATAGLTAAANQHVTVSGTGLFKHGTKTLLCAGCDFVGMAEGFYDVSSMRITGLNVDVDATIRLPVGARVTAIRVFIKDNNAAGATKLTASFRSVTSAGTKTTIASSSESAGNNTNQTLTVTPSATTLVAGTFYVVTVVVTTQAGTDDCNVWGCEVDYDQP